MLVGPVLRIQNSKNNSKGQTQIKRPQKLIIRKKTNQKTLSQKGSVPYANLIFTNSIDSPVEIS